MSKRIYIYLIGLLVCDKIYSQDPHFTQFNAAPITINPNYVGVFDGNVRITSNQRRQWFNVFDPYLTTSLGLDFKLKLKSSENNLQNPLNLGVFILSDRSLKSAYKSDCVSSAISYHVTLDNDGYKSLGGALFGSYTSKRLDFNSLSFDAQFVANGFDLRLPNGESYITNLKPFATVGAGLLYLYNNPDDGSFFDFGISGYNLNQPNQTFYSDTTSILPFRISSHLSYQKYFNDKSYFSVKAIFQKQGNVKYILGGFTLGRAIGSHEENKYLIGVGAWYRTGDAISPQLILDMQKIQLGVSYDIAFNDLKNGPKPSRSIEFSLQWRLGSSQIRQ
jgi:type IX secretion system PorP/SprF family membrane protein